MFQFLDIIFVLDRRHCCMHNVVLNTLNFFSHLPKIMKELKSTHKQASIFPKNLLLQRFGLKIALSPKYTIANELKKEKNIIRDGYN